ncbi:MAG: hypothetical protein J5574_05535 [Lachnospiraceae bacterium]|nr:hypothetical protein [Lachnospiraceae bacterium]
MGNLIFWICFLLLIAVLAVSEIHRSKERKASRIRKLRDDQDSDADTCFSETQFRDKSGMLDYLRGIKPEDEVIDGITAHDLMLEEIYVRMNRCVSGAGAEYLNCRFRMMSSSPDEIAKTRNETDGFINDPGKAHEIRCIIDMCPKGSDDDGFRLVSDLERANGSSVISDIIPVAALAVSFCIMPLFMKAGTVAAIISLCFCIGTYFSGRSRMEGSLKGLAFCLKYIRCASRLSECGVSGFDQYRDLSGLAKAAFLIPYKDQTTSNPLSLLFDYVRMITHIDLISYKIRIAGIRANTDRIKNLYTDIGRLDCLTAVASYLAKRDHCDAVITDDDRLVTKGIYHPLVNGAVKNDIDTARGILLTGSNASGKSTFLKAVGISTLFAQSFGIAFADTFETGRCKLLTSMALSDNLLGGESYYVVEARSLKRICDAASCGRSLCIIDEVLRGTNTVERIAASTAILKHLARPGVFLFAATHDLELPGMLKGFIDCFYFTEEIQDGEVVFPYVLNEGTTDRTNAIRLLSAMEFDNGITTEAQNLVDKYRNSGKWVMTN